jgi:hypothetical protein
MGWDVGQKKFIRENPDYSGASVWQQDQQASIKIIASRHDIHDQDLADGISRCLNIDGVNSLAANLDFNNYKGINLAAGSQPTDTARFGQVIDSAVFSNSTRDLTLSTPDGVEFTVNIPATGPGVGTVEEISAGDGLTATPNPITISGEISLETLGVGQTFSGGIMSITIDKHGRVTQVNTGALGGTNLGATPASSTVLITSSTGNDATIPAATSSQAGVMTATDKNKLNSVESGANNYEFTVAEITGQPALTSGLEGTDELLVNDGGVLKRMDIDVLAAYLSATGAGMKPPTSIPADTTIFSRMDQIPVPTYQASVNNNWTNVISVTGEGLIEFLGTYINGTPPGNFQYRLLIDGVEVFISATNAWVSGTDYSYRGFVIIGAAAVDGTEVYLEGMAFGQVKFDQSFQLQMRNTSNATSDTCAVKAKYQVW